MRRGLVFLAVFVAGFAALSWEIIWQLKLSLAIGFSSLGTALTLATTMAGMTVGSLLMGKFVEARPLKNPLQAYLILELVVGTSGLALEPGFRVLERWDTLIYQQAPGAAPLIYILSAVALLGLPTLALGATIPIFALISELSEVPLSWLYGMNTAGASLGCLGIAFALLPALGVTRTIYFVSGLNFTAACLVILLAFGERGETVQGAEHARTLLSPCSPRVSLLVVFVTGFVTFGLEIAWFRSLRAAFGSRTESFAVMLSAVLIALALGARLAGYLSKAQKTHLFPRALVLSGFFIMVATPLVERFDLFPFPRDYYQLTQVRWLATLLVTGPAVALLGTALPWLLDTEREPRNCARLYAFNTLGAILGSVCGAWLLIPTLGFARTAWFLGLVVGVLGLVAGKERAVSKALILLAGLTIAVGFESGVGRQRVQISFKADEMAKILDYAETPESTISVVEMNDGRRDLIIDGFVTTGTDPEATHYMKWMGHLPMLLHPRPENTLVICFGTGQTAFALWQEGAEKIDIVELNREVLGFAPNFASNHNILEKNNVFPHVMDGRAWLRRTRTEYDVITLEPMAPTFAGVNNLYSREFYELSKDRLSKGGIACQWLPFHLLHPNQTLAIAAAFQEVFPNSGLWLDPVGYTGLLVGIKDGPPVGSEWPGLSRDIDRSLTAEQVKRMMVLDPAGMERFTQRVTPITDDNQELAYGSLRKLKQGLERKASALNVIHWASTDPPPARPDYRELLELRVELPLEAPD